MHQRSSIVTAIALAACLVVVLGRGWTAAAAHDETPQGQPPLATLRAKRIALERQTRRLERRVSTLEAAVAYGSEDDSATANSKAKLQVSFSRLQAELPGKVGVAFGAPGGAVTVFGSLTSGSAWSTMKVPVAVAFVRQTGVVSDTVRRAITLSDNGAAMVLWEVLGSSTGVRVVRVQKVLSDAGDRATRVQGRVVRAGFTPFGQTIWSLRAQQAFAAHLPCVQGARQVLRLMGQIDPSQRWGLGRVGAQPAFKGGWGPNDAGAYLVRQFGLVRLRSGTLAVAIAAQPADGSFETGVRYLDRLAQWVASHAVGGRLAACR